MTSPLPQHLQDEQRALEAEIREAFKGVTREGGVSWSESVAIDDHGAREGNKARATARAADADQSWEQLVDDPQWDADRGTGGFTFLDPTGFRYYLPPKMIRASRRGWDGELGFSLNADSSPARYRVSILSEAQARAVARFLRFMVAAAQDEIDREAWERTYGRYWNEPDPVARLVYLDGDRIIIDASRRVEIPLSDCDSWDKVSDLMSQLGEQDGMTPHMLVHFSMVAAVHNRLKAHD